MPITGTPTHIVADVTLTAPATYIEATGLDINRDGPYTIRVMLHEVSGTTSKVWLYINGDTTNSHYYAQRVYYYGTGRTIANYNEPYTTYCIANGTPVTTIDLYRDVDGYPRWTARTCYNVNISLRLLLVAARKTAAVTNITEIRLTSADANGFGAGTRLIVTRIGH